MPWLQILIAIDAKMLHNVDTGGTLLFKQCVGLMIDSKS